MKIDTINYRGIDIKIYIDEDPMDPRDGDNIGKMICFHNRHTLGDKHEFKDPQEALKMLHQDAIVYFPLYLLDHSGLRMNVGGFYDSDPQGWDWGQVGWIYTDKKRVRDFLGWKRITKLRKEKIREYLMGEVDTYDNYLAGSVYGYDTGSDSCWGFFGCDHEASGLLPEARAVIDRYLKVHGEQLTFKELEDEERNTHKPA